MTFVSTQKMRDFGIITLVKVNSKLTNHANKFHPDIFSSHGFEFYTDFVWAACLDGRVV